MTVPFWLSGLAHSGGKILAVLQQQSKARLLLRSANMNGLKLLHPQLCRHPQPQRFVHLAGWSLKLTATFTAGIMLL